MEQFLLFIIIAIASLVLNRKKNANKQEADQRAEQGHSPVQQAPMVEVERQDIGRSAEYLGTPDVARNLREAVDIMFPQTKPSPQRKDDEDEVASRMDRLKEQENKYRAQAQTVRNRSAEIKNKAARHAMGFQMKENDIVKGIIMAEVLGPPRALKPYGRK